MENKLIQLFQRTNGSNNKTTTKHYVINIHASLTIKTGIILAIIILLTSCSINNVQHQKFYKDNVRGVITDIYKNNIGGNTVVLDGKLNVNVWDEDLDSTLVIGNVKSFNVKWLTRKIKK